MRGWSVHFMEVLVPAITNLREGNQDQLMRDTMVRNGKWKSVGDSLELKREKGRHG